MITLYQLSWSHYVEKVRWALDYKGIEWTAVDVDPFTKKEMQHLNCQLRLETGRELYTVPTIHDQAGDVAVGDSSRILDYLERTYPTPALYPIDPQERAEVERWMLWLDSTVGLAGRRLGYTQIALEHPSILATLFVPRMLGPKGRESAKAKIAGVIIAGVLSRRFRFLHNRSDRVFEELEHCLRSAAARLSSRAHLVGDRFTAADVTLAALSRPARLIPYFRQHPDLQGLWDWRTQLLREHHRQQEIGYEVELHRVRKQRGWALGNVRWLSGERNHGAPLSTDIPALTRARNDQQSVGRWPMISGPIWYLRLALGANLGRTPYHG
jgi:glutathione S-transferase